MVVTPAAKYAIVGNYGDGARSERTSGAVLAIGEDGSWLTHRMPADSDALLRLFVIVNATFTSK